MEERVSEIEPTHFLKGIEQIANCLQQLQQKYRLVHGDITSANILVDENFDFYLIDFGISDVLGNIEPIKRIRNFRKKICVT